MYVITGATGHIGGRIARTLLRKGRQVRVIGRSMERLNPLVELGAEASAGTLTDETFLTSAFSGAEAVFTMIPPDLKTEDFRGFQKSVTSATCKALDRTGVKRVVNLSSLGADRGSGNGPIAGLHDQEERLAKIKGLSVVNLRAAFFMENLIPNIAMIRDQGLNGTPLKPDLRIPMIATCDIADAAVECLMAPGTPGTTVLELLGQRDLSMNEVTAIMSEAMKMPNLLYVQFPYGAAREAMLKAGLSESIADLFIEMYKAINSGKLMNDLVRSSRNTTETSFEKFLQDALAW